MERFTGIVERGAPTGRLALPFEKRRRARQRASLASGEAVALMLPRGRALRDGDLLLAAATGRIVEVAAAPEPVSMLRTADAATLARAAYHLGNRHVPVQVGTGWLRYLTDRVLDDMVRGLGLEPEAGCAPFEPEAGAYGAHPHGRRPDQRPDHLQDHARRPDHDHDHDQGRDQGHDQDHDQDRGHARSC